MYKASAQDAEMMMNTAQTSIWHHENQYNSQSSCPYCEGILRHELWCITMNALVQYAYGLAAGIRGLSAADALRLHAMGVCWK
jgi:hypothetical protein